MRRTVFVFLLCLASCSSSHAFDGEPTGFGGFPWGLPVRPGDGFSLVRSDPSGVSVYERPGDGKRFEGLETDILWYKFLQGKLAAGDIMVRGKEEFDRLRKACFSRFGRVPPVESDREEYVWVGIVSIVDLRYFEEKGEGWMTVVSTEAAIEGSGLLVASARPRGGA